MAAGAIALALGGNGAGGAVDLTVSDTVDTFGKQSGGVIAQSIGGGGGNGGGEVTATLHGNTVTHGDQSAGVTAQSVGGGATRANPIA